MQRSNEERARAWLRGMPLWGDASNVSGDAYRRQLVPSLTALLAEAEERGRTEAIEACARFLEAGGRAYEANEVRKADWLSEGLPLHVQADIAQAAHAFCSDWGIDSQPPRDDLEDLLTSVHAEATEAERERIVGIVEERAENGEPVAKLVRAIRRRGNDQTSGNAAEPSAVVTEQHAPARAPEEAGTISRTKVKHPWANVVATAVCVVDGSATQHDLVVAVRAMQDKAYGVPRSAEAQADDDFIWDACEVHGRFKLGPKMGGRFRAACPACEGPRSNEAKPAVAACSECGATSGSFCASLVDGKPLCFPECRPRSDKATPRPWNAMPHTHGMWTVEREIVPAENVAGRSYRADVICEVSPTEARYGESARSAEENARRIADALNDQYGWYGPNTEAALRRERDCPSPTERRAWGHADSDEAEMWTGAFATREEAIADGRQNYPGEAFWIVEGTYPDPAEFTPNADSIIDTMIENASAEVGDAVDNWEPSDGAEKALDELLEAWARRHMPTNFYIADGVKERIDPLPDRKRNPMASDSSSEGKRGGESR